VPITPHACVSVHCDTCGEHLGLDDEAHFASDTDARTAAASYQWRIDADGRVTCADDVRAALAAPQKTTGA
jgi:hypothetical protein